jgi:hypothetical protein
MNASVLFAMSYAMRSCDSHAILLPYPPRNSTRLVVILEVFFAHAYFHPETAQDSETCTRHVHDAHHVHLLHGFDSVILQRSTSFRHIQRWPMDSYMICMLFRMSSTDNGDSRTNVWYADRWDRWYHRAGKASIQL